MVRSLVYIAVLHSLARSLSNRSPTAASSSRHFFRPFLATVTTMTTTLSRSIVEKRGESLYTA